MLLFIRAFLNMQHVVWVPLILVSCCVFRRTQTGSPAGMIPMRSMHDFSSASGRFWSTLLSVWVLATNPCRISLNIPSPPTQTTLETQNKSTQVSLLRIVPSKKEKKKSPAWLLLNELSYMYMCLQKGTNPREK